MCCGDFEPPCYDLSRSPPRLFFPNLFMLLLLGLYSLLL